MTVTAVIPFDTLQMPAHLAAAFGTDENILERQTTPALTFRGKTWRMRIGGEETVLTRVDENGESMPMQTVQVVVLNLNQKRSRVFYQGGFVEGKNSSPVCWSTDGAAPDTDVSAPCAKTCASCPNSVKGSKITESGHEVMACAPVKRLAVVPIVRLDMEPLLLKVPQTSIWDKNNPEADARGCYAWDQYTDFLRQRGVKHTAAVVTRIRFDPNVAYPKLLFSAGRWLTAEETAMVVPLVNTEAVQKLLVGKISEGGDVAEVATEAPAAPAAGAAPVAPVAPPPVVAGPVVTPSGWDDDPIPAATPVVAPKPVAPAAPKPTPPKTRAAAPKPAPVAPVAPAAPAAIPGGTGGATANLAALAAAWDD